MQVRAADHPEPVTPFGRAFDQAGVGEEIAADANFAREGQIDFAVVRKRQEFKPIQEIVALCLVGHGAPILGPAGRGEATHDLTFADCFAWVGIGCGCLILALAYIVSGLRGDGRLGAFIVTASRGQVGLGSSCKGQSEHDRLHDPRFLSSCEKLAGGR